MSDAVQVARSNTVRGIETCGVLAGSIVRRACSVLCSLCPDSEQARDTLFVTTLIIPKQEGTTDTCATLNEEDLFLYQDKHNLLTLGWIHVRHLTPLACHTLTRCIARRTRRRTAL
jgi:STAM-binding protein